MPHTSTTMTKEDIKVILDILDEKYDFDRLDQVEFVMEYERRSGNKIPDKWLGMVGKVKTVKH